MVVVSEIIRKGPVDNAVYLFCQISSAMRLVIPACRQMELNVPWGMLRLFLGTITTRFRPSYSPAYTSSLPRLLSVMPICAKIHATSELDTLLGMLNFQGYGFERLFVLRVFGKEKFFQRIHGHGARDLVSSIL
jgi:hypothetical protein